MSTTLNLKASASVVLDGNGDGAVGIGPALPGVSWQPSSIAVSVSTNTNEAQANIYLGIAPGAGDLLAATSTGSTGDSTDCNETVWPGQQVIAQWTGGDPGAVATMSVFGTRQVP